MINWKTTSISLENEDDLKSYGKLIRTSIYNNCRTSLNKFEDDLNFYVSERQME
jgi:hypothetical protein